MKLSKLLLCAVPAMMFAACSNEDAPAPGNGTTFEGEGYLAVNINLPQTPASRANDIFDDGKAYEYKVTDGAILLFVGADEATATLHGGYLLDVEKPINDVDDDNITASFLRSINVGDITLDENNNLYGLVVLNYKKVLQIGGTGVTVNGTTFSGTFGQLLAMTSGADFFNTTAEGYDYFFMANSPLSTAQGAVANPAGNNFFTLVNLNKALYPTQAEAEAAPSASIFVERAVAKTTVSQFPTEAKLISQNPDGTTKTTVRTIVSSSWTLGNTETSSYIVRNLGSDLTYMGYNNADANNYRMVGNAMMGTTSIQPALPLYRTYWCIDPTYDTNHTQAQADALMDAAISTPTAGTDPAPLYCYENTFTVDNQNYLNTTRIVFKVQYEGGAFYTVNNNQNNILATTDEAESYSRAFIINDVDLVNALKAVTKPDVTINVADYVEVIFNRNEATGFREVTAINFVNLDDNFTGTPVFNPAELIAAVNAQYVIREYADGISYYPLLIKHFGDDLTPWSTDATTTPTTADSYKGNANDYLGRYGMVRNNWYDIQVSDITNLGSPVVPTGNYTTPDDNVDNEKWIAFTVNIAAWAKRVQVTPL